MSARAASTASSSSTATSTTPLAVITSSGPTSAALTSPSPPPAIMAGPPMPREARGVATTRSEQPATTALPAKQGPSTTAIRGTRPESRAQAAKVVTSSAETSGMSVSPGRPPPPAAKNTQGSESRSTTSRSRSVLRCPRMPWVPAITR